MKAVRKVILYSLSLWISVCFMSGCNAMLVKANEALQTGMTGGGLQYSYDSTTRELVLTGDGSLNGKYSPSRWGYASELDDLGFDIRKITLKDCTLWGSMGHAFAALSSVSDITFDHVYTSRVTKMNSMFAGCNGLTMLDLSSLDTSNVVDMSYMFDGCIGLNGLDVSGWDTSQVTTMSHMFANCWVQSLDLGFDTWNVVDMDSMFLNCIHLTRLDISHFDTRKVRSMRRMFSECDWLKSLKIKGFETSNVTDMKEMFAGCGSLSILDLSSFNVREDADVGQLLDGCHLNVIYSPYDTNGQIIPFGSDDSVFLDEMGNCVIGMKTSGKSHKYTREDYQAGPEITTQPTNQSVEEGKNVIFKVVATGTNLTYQWKVSSNNGSSWSTPAAASAKTANYSLTTKYAMNGYLFKCVITDANGETVETNAVKLTVISAGPVITTQPVAQTVTEGAKATFKVVASGEGLTYQWKVSSNNGTSWTTPTAASAKTPSYGITTKFAQNGYLFKCVITDANKKVVETNAVKLTVKSNGPKITTQPTDQIVDVGTKATFKVVATGDGLTYQWKVSGNNGTSWSTPTAAAAKTAAYGITTKAAQNGYLFKCVITDANGKTVETNAVKLTVKVDAPVITTQPTAQSVTAGAKATFKVVAVGDGLTYQWKISANNGTSWTTPTAKAAKTANYSFTTKAAQNGYLVKCVITDANGKSVESNAVKLTVK